MSIIDKILEKGLLSNSKIILPEIDDSRIKKAKIELKSIGYDIVEIEGTFLYI